LTGNDFTKMTITIKAGHDQSSSYIGPFSMAWPPGTKDKAWPCQSKG
jgi:hypothetical protein